MRSRYAAFAKGEVEYLRATQTKDADDAWVIETRRWASSVAWLSLEIIDRVKGGVDDATGEVEFIARYLDGDTVTALRERSRFERRDGRWIYDAGEPRVTTTKVERNAACPCGSGKKFKACHA